MLLDVSRRASLLRVGDPGVLAYRVLTANVLLLSSWVNVGGLAEQDLGALVLYQGDKVEVLILLYESKGFRSLGSILIVIGDIRNHLAVCWNNDWTERGSLIELEFVSHAFEIDIHGPVVVVHFARHLVVTTLDRDPDEGV